MVKQWKTARVKVMIRGKVKLRVGFSVRVRVRVTNPNPNPVQRKYLLTSLTKGPSLKALTAMG